MIITDQELGERLCAWAESLTSEEKAEARAKLIQWCEAVKHTGDKS